MPKLNRKQVEDRWRLADSNARKARKVLADVQANGKPWKKAAAIIAKYEREAAKWLAKLADFKVGR